MGFLGTRAGPLADLALIISIAGFIILCLGVVYAKRGVLVRHFTMTRLAVFLLVIAFIWMGPRFIGSLPIIIFRLTSLPVLTRYSMPLSVLLHYLQAYFLHLIGQ